MTAAACVALAILAGVAVYQYRKVRHMSASLDRLKAAVASVSAKVTALEVALSMPPAGAPDSELDALSTQLEALAAPTVPAPPPAAE